MHGKDERTDGIRSALVGNKRNGETRFERVLVATATLVAVSNVAVSIVRT